MPIIDVSQEPLFDGTVTVPQDVWAIISGTFDYEMIESIFNLAVYRDDTLLTSQGPIDFTSKQARGWGFSYQDLPGAGTFHYVARLEPLATNPFPDRTEPQPTQINFTKLACMAQVVRR